MYQESLFNSNRYLLFVLLMSSDWRNCSRNSQLTANLRFPVGLASMFLESGVQFYTQTTEVFPVTCFAQALNPVGLGALLRAGMKVGLLSLAQPGLLSGLQQEPQPLFRTDAAHQHPNSLWIKVRSLYRELVSAGFDRAN